MKDIEDIAASLIDTSWHYSWHWERSRYGELTLNGWVKMLEDARERLADVQRQQAKLAALIPEIEKEVKKRAEWEKEDEQG